MNLAGMPSARAVQPAALGGLAGFDGSFLPIRLLCKFSEMHSVCVSITLVKGGSLFCYPSHRSKLLKCPTSVNPNWTSYRIKPVKIGKFASL